MWYIAKMLMKYILNAICYYKNKLNNCFQNKNNILVYTGQAFLNEQWISLCVNFLNRKFLTVISTFTCILFILCLGIWTNNNGINMQKCKPSREFP